MLNTAFRITPLDPVRSMLHWQSDTPETVSWVFLNGIHVAGPHVVPRVERSIRIPMGANSVMAIEIHDFQTPDIVPAPITIRPNTRPFLHWLPVEDAVRYRVYHRSEGSPEKRIGDIPARDGLGRYHLQCPILLKGDGGVWHFFRVESVSLYGYESARESWNVYVRDLPATAPRVEVTHGSGAGLYSFSLG